MKPGNVVRRTVIVRLDVHPVSIQSRFYGLSFLKNKKRNIFENNERHTFIKETPCTAFVCHRRRVIAVSCRKKGIEHKQHRVARVFLSL